MDRSQMLELLNKHGCVEPDSEAEAKLLDELVRDGRAVRSGNVYRSIRNSWLRAGAIVSSLVLVLVLAAVFVTNYWRDRELRKYVDKYSSPPSGAAPLPASAVEQLRPKEKPAGQ